MKVAYFDAREGDRERLTREFSNNEVVVFSERLNAATIDRVRSAEVLSVFVSSAVTADYLTEMPQLRMIAARSAGVDHIDLAACRERAIIVSNVPRYGEYTVAEHTFALILALSRKIFQSYERTEQMNFDQEGLTGFDLRGKTLGVVGTGNIGRNVIGIGKGFGMHVVAFDVSPDQSLAEGIGFSYVTRLEDLLAMSDVVTLHVPLLEATHHMINADTLSVMRQGAILVNTARGGLIDSAALLAALREGRLAGVGLDVLEEEDDVADRLEFMAGDPAYEELVTLLHNHLLVARDDVIITPHNAYNSREAVDRIFNTTIQNIQRFETGKPQNVVSGLA